MSGKFLDTIATVGLKELIRHDEVRVFDDEVLDPKTDLRAFLFLLDKDVQGTRFQLIARGRFFLERRTKRETVYEKTCLVAPPAGAHL